LIPVGTIGVLPRSLVVFDRRYALGLRVIAVAIIAMSGHPLPGQPPYTC